MNKINIVIPMAGAGSRFAKAGYKKPKPFIDVLGKPMICHVLDNLKLGLNEKYSVSSWRKTFAYHYYEKYKDISYLMWLFNQHSVNIAFKFIDVDENMNLRFREGVCL